MELLESNQIRVIALVALALLLAVTWFVFRGTRRVPGRTIRVVGVGGAGGKALDAMISAGLKGVDYLAVNTDLRALNRCSARTKLAIGRSVTRGLGAGGDVSVGTSAAREAAEEIGRVLDGSDLVVIVAGLGGGTGSGAAPVVADIARQQGALTVAVVTKPFAFEGFRRARIAQDAAAALIGLVDAVATVPNDQVRDVMPSEVTVENAFQAIDEAVCRNVAEIVDLVAVPGRINLDFADVRAVLGRGGAAAVGSGRADGENRAADATRRAMAATLLENRMKGAGAVLVNVSGSRKLRLAELDAVAETVLATTGRDTNLVFGVSLNPRLRDEVQVTLIAAGSGAGLGVEAPAVSEAAAVKTPIYEAESLTPEEVEAPSAMAFQEDPQAWRPVWLRRATPPSTRAPESTAAQRPARKSSGQRSRRSAAGPPEPKRATQSEESV
jgi:cell division protein FtsZ